MSNISTQNYHANQAGLSLLVIVIILGLAGLTLAVGSSLLGLGELELSVISDQGYETAALADACTEEALRQLQIDSGYSGSAVSLGDGSCAIDIVSAGSNRTVTVTSTLDVYTQVVQVQAVVSGSTITATSWLEL